MENNVIALPLAKPTIRVHQRRRLSIERSAGSVSVSFILIRVQNLDLVPVLEYDTAVGTPLTPHLRFVWEIELYMNLRIPEFHGTRGIKRAGAAALRNNSRVLRAPRP